jgi:phosphoribosylformimino-5-aminoimidazole carboxamide ribotide isomerase
LGEIGFDDAIIIDLDRVGSFKGIDIGMIQKLLSIDMKLYIGGGIRDINDIVLLDQMEVYGVLIASALHNRSINIDELRQHGYL